MIVMILVQLGSGIGKIGFVDGAQKMMEAVLTQAGFKARVFQIMAFPGLGIPGTYYSLCAFISLPFGEKDWEDRLNQVLGDQISKIAGFKNGDMMTIVATPKEFPVFGG